MYQVTATWILSLVSSGLQPLTNSRVRHQSRDSICPPACLPWPAPGSQAGWRAGTAGVLPRSLMVGAPGLEATGREGQRQRGDGRGRHAGVWGRAGEHKPDR